MRINCFSKQFPVRGGPVLPVEAVDTAARLKLLVGSLRNGLVRYGHCVEALGGGSGDEAIRNLRGMFAGVAA